MKVIIIGASSGIGAEVAKRFLQQGHKVAITARHLDLLEEIIAPYPDTGHALQMDVQKPEESVDQLHQLIEQLDGLDLLIVNPGINHLFPNWEQAMSIIQTNVVGCTALLQAGYEYFVEQGKGHLVGVSSIAAIRGSGPSPPYGASKAFIMRYLEGLRKRIYHKGYDITVTDIRPGYTATKMTAGQKKLFWTNPLDKAVDHIIKAIEREKKVAYILPRWRLIAIVMQHVPWWIYRKI